jgi:prepilin-type N-terminal cleavage/methylation domain-containing protein
MSNIRAIDYKSIERGEQGLTLIEVMVSTVMLGIVMAGLGQGLTLGIRLNTEAKNRVASLSVCKRVTEVMKSQIQYDKPTFDGANSNTNFNAVFYCDVDGNKLAADSTDVTVFEATPAVADWADAGGNTLSQGGTVLVKTLIVRVRLFANTQGNREVAMTVEMVRPN